MACSAFYSGYAVCEREGNSVSFLKPSIGTEGFGSQPTEIVRLRNDRLPMESRPGIIRG